MRSLFDNPEIIVPSGDFVSRFTPRPYQQLAQQNFFREVDGGADGALVRLCTGGGKTFIGSWIGADWVSRSDDHYVMVVAHERQLVHQFAEEIRELLGVEVGIEMSDDGRVRFESGLAPRFIVASRATLQEDGGTSRLYKFDWRKHWLLICDECHRWTYSMKSCRHIIDWFEQNPESRRLGLTATPERGDGVTFERLFPSVALDYRMYDLDGGPSAVNDGWAVPYDQRFVEVAGVDFANLREVAGDFKDDELDALLSQKEQLDSLIQPTLDLVEDRRTIIFNPGVGMAQAVAAAINAEREYRLENGLPCEFGEAKALDGSADEVLRNSVFEEHKSGKIQFLSVCGLCREGYNDPGIRAVAIFRPTKSRPLAEQMKGRGCRPLKGILEGLETAEERKAAIAASEKPTCMIIDLVGISGLADVASTAHLLAVGKPDSVVERANENARKKDGPVDMAEELRNAEEELEQERIEQEQLTLKLKAEAEAEAAREAARLAEEARKAEAEKMARVRSKVHYSERKVEHGGVAIGGGSSSVEPGIMPFGRFAGQKLAELPEWYLQWGAREVKQASVRKQMERELNRRYGRDTVATPSSSSPATDKQIAVLKRFGFTADGLTYGEAGRIITEKVNSKLTTA